MLKEILIKIAVYVSACYMFWKLGEKNAAKKEYIRTLEARQKNIRDAVNIRKSADIDELRKKYKR